MVSSRSKGTGHRGSEAAGSADAGSPAARMHGSPAARMHGSPDAGSAASGSPEPSSPAARMQGHMRCAMHTLVYLYLDIIRTYLLHYLYIRVVNIWRRPRSPGSALAMRPYMRGPGPAWARYPGIGGSALPLGGGSETGTPAISFRYIIDFTPPYLRPHGVKKKKRGLTFPDLFAIIQASPAFDAPGMLLEGIHAAAERGHFSLC